MTEEESEDAENDARREMQKADDEAAAYRAWEQREALVRLSIISIT